MATGHKTGGCVAGTPNKATTDIQKRLTALGLLAIHEVLGIHVAWFYFAAGTVSGSKQHLDEWSETRVIVVSEAWHDDIALYPSGGLAERASSPASVVGHGRERG